MMKKTLKIIGSILMILAVFGVTGYFFLFYERPVDQAALNAFLENQPVIDVHMHITRGFPENELYNQLDPDINTAKMKWMTSELDKNNIVLALAGGPAELLNAWAGFDDRYWVGVIFPCSHLVEQDQPCDKGFYTYRNGKPYTVTLLLRCWGNLIQCAFHVPIIFTVWLSLNVDFFISLEVND